MHEIIPALQSLHATLVGLESEYCHEQTSILAWGYLADACEKVTRCENFNCEDVNAPFIKTILMKAARYLDPSLTEYRNLEGRTMGSSEARIDAAKGIMRLAKFTIGSSSSIKFIGVKAGLPVKYTGSFFRL